MFIHGATARRGQKTINLCSVGHHGGVIVAVMMALLVIVFFVEVVVFFKWKKQSTCAVALVVIVVSGVLGCGFFAVALCIHWRHSAAIILCQSAVLCAVALRFVPLHSFLCHGNCFVLQ